MDEPDIREAGIGEGPEPAPLSDGIENVRSVEQKFLEHFGLHEQPFGVTPDPRFLYLGPKHRQALAALNYGTDSNRGFLTLIAQPGMGKTSLLLNYLEGLRNRARTVYLFQTDCDSRELMCYLLADLGLDGTGKDLPEMHSMLNQVLTEEMRIGRQFVLVIDEAQNLTEKVLESVRLLSNFETPWMKLMQIVLAGQPQLAKRLARPSMAQLRQRISFEIRIEPLTPEEAVAYIDHRLWVAGYKGSDLFSKGALRLLAEKSGGIPRTINNLCFCAMSLAWATKRKTIEREMILDVSTEMNPGSPKPKTEFAPKTAQPSTQRTIQNISPQLLMMKEPPARGWLPKVALASAMLIALGWSGVHSGFGKRLTVLLRNISLAEKSSILPMAAPLSPLSIDPGASASPGNPSDGQTVEAPTSEKNPGSQVESGPQSKLSDQEPN